MKDVGLMVERDGLRSLWRGLNPTLWRDVPFSCIYWFGYENLKSILQEGNSTENNNGSWNAFQNSFIAGATSGMVNE